MLYFFSIKTNDMFKNYQSNRGNLQYREKALTFSLYKKHMFCCAYLMWTNREIKDNFAAKPPLRSDLGKYYSCSENKNPHCSVLKMLNWSLHNTSDICKYKILTINWQFKPDNYTSCRTVMWYLLDCKGIVSLLFNGYFITFGFNSI